VNETPLPALSIAYRQHHMSRLLEAVPEEGWNRWLLVRPP